MTDTDQNSSKKCSKEETTRWINENSNSPQQSFPIHHRPKCYTAGNIDLKFKNKSKNLARAKKSELQTTHEDQDQSESEDFRKRTGSEGILTARS